MTNPTEEVLRKVKEKLAIERLDSVYSQARQATVPYLFFRSLIEYVSLFGRSEILNAIAQAIVEEERSQTAPLNALEKITVQEMQQVYVQIKNFVAENAITDGEIAFSLEGASGQLASTLDPIECRYQALNDLMYMLMTHHFARSKVFMKKFAKIAEASPPKDNAIVSTTYSAAYHEWHDEHTKYQRQKITEAWFSWKEIYDFYQTYHDYEVQRKELSDKGKSLERMSHSYVFQKVNRFVNDTDQTPESTQAMELYRNHLERVHFHVKSLLEGLVAANTVAYTDTYPTFHFDTASGVLQVNQHKMTFEGARKDYLAILTRDPKAEWDYTDFYNEVEPHHQVFKLEQKMKHAIYDRCREITVRIAAKTGVKNFLIYADLMVKINPMYSAH
jgi:hypothetical protein